MHILWVCALIAFAVAPTMAQNVNTTTYDSVIGKVTVAPEPALRGTFGIILSATATFAFCVWRGVHPDIIPAVSSWYRVFYKSIWMFVAVLLPEGIIVCAYGQLQEAKKIHRKWIETVKPKGDAGKDWVDTFGMKGAFFVVMGGFIIDEFELKEKRDNPGCLPCFTQELETMVSYTSTLTPMGFKKYLHSGHIDKDTFGPTFADDGSIIHHSIGLRSLADKGNSSVATKFIASVQILWFLVQCASRGAQGLPLTLLEIHVAIQVLTTVITGLCWLEKPSEVNEPILIRLRAIPEGTSENREESLTSNPEKETYAHLETPTSNAGTSAVDKEAMTPLGPPSGEATLKVENKSQPPPEPFPRGQDLRNDRIVASTEYKLEDSEGNKVHHDVITKSSSPRISPIIAKALYDITKHVDGGQDNSIVVLVEAILVCIIGTLHAAAWNSHFPSFVESIMWKISSLGICLFPLAVAFLTLRTGYQTYVVKAIWGAQFLEPGFCYILKYTWEQIYVIWDEGVVAEAKKGRHSTLSALWWGFLHFLMIAVCSFCVIGYGFSILFITVESYISMRDPPKGTFLIAKWNSYWPHV